MDKLNEDGLLKEIDQELSDIKTRIAAGVEIKNQVKSQMNQLNRKYKELRKVKTSFINSLMQLKQPNNV